MSLQPDVWAVWPTVSVERSRAQVVKWKARGYKVGVLLNPPGQETDLPEADLVTIQSKWVGFPAAADHLCQAATGNIVVVVGDDVMPDPDKTAQEIGEQFLERFPDTNGVMQPTADKFGLWDICAVSPWIGREFIRTVYEGQGPYWPGYFHYFSDHELQVVAEGMGCFQQRPDILQYHDHWQRHEGKKRPKHLVPALHRWNADRRLFLRRKAAGFPCR